MMASSSEREHAELACARRAWQEGDAARARHHLDRHLARYPAHGGALQLRARMALGEGRHDAAVADLLQALEGEPACAELWCDLGAALRRRGDHGPAQEAYGQAMKLRPDHPDALFGLGELLRQDNRPQEALRFYALLLERVPDYRHGWHHTGLALLALGRHAEARGCLERELTRHPRDSAARVTLGRVLRAAGNAHAAIDILRLGLAQCPQHAELHLELGDALAAVGMKDDAVACLRRALALAPALPAAHESLIRALDADAGADTATQQAARREWYRHCVLPAASAAVRPHRRPDPWRRLRVGYVCAGFGDEAAVARFAPLLFHGDRGACEVHCFSNSAMENALTARIRAAVDRFECIAALSDTQAAALIRAARIDILVDLSGHSEGNRLALFAQRAAPLQIAGWGGANGSGMPAMDLVAADERFLSDADLAHFAEARLEVPAVLTWAPPHELPTPSPPPALARGFVTFGCQDNPGALTHASVRLFSRVLNVVPGAELVLKSAAGADAAALEEMRRRFVNAGVAAPRIHFLPCGERDADMEYYAMIDIQLDPLTGSGVALLEGVALGVPSLTLKGSTPPARLGAALLGALGIDADWSARSEDDYVAMAAAWAARVPALAGLRAGLRARLLRSPLGDGAGYARAVEAAFRKAWSGCCGRLAAARETALGQARDALAAGHGLQALSAVEGLLAGDEDDAEALLLAGQAALLLDQPAAAADLLERALRLLPGLADAWAHLATARARQGREQEAQTAQAAARRLRQEDVPVR